MKAPQTVGSRIRGAREAAELTQQQLATNLGLSRAAVAQWEADVTSPSIARIYEAARFFQNVSAEFLAFGVTGDPVVVIRGPEGTTKIREVTFGDAATDQSVAAEWLMPETYVRSDLRIPSPESVIVWRVEGDTLAPSYEHGDRVVVDTNSKRPSPPGVFLIWDGVGPCLANVNVVHAAGGKQSAKVSTGADSYEVPIDKLSIIGRARGRLHSS